MKNRRFQKLKVLFVLISLFSANVVFAEKVGILDVDLLMREASQAKESKVQLTAEFKKRHNVLETAQKKIAECV